MDGTTEEEWESVPGLNAAYARFRTLFEELCEKDPTVARFIITDLKRFVDKPRQQITGQVLQLSAKHSSTIEPPANTNSPKRTPSTGEFALFVLAIVQAKYDIRMNLIFEAFQKANLDVGNQVACFRRIKRLASSVPNGEERPLFTWPEGQLPPVRLTPEGQKFYLELLCGTHPKLLTERELDDFMPVLESVVSGVTQRSADVRMLMKGKTKSES